MILIAKNTFNGLKGLHPLSIAKNTFKKVCPKCKFYLCICNLKNIFYKYNGYIHIKKIK